MTLTPTPNQAARERAHHADHDVDRAEEGQRRHRGVRHVVAEERVAVEPNLVLEPVDLPVATASGMTHRRRSRRAAVAARTMLCIMKAHEVEILDGAVRPIAHACDCEVLFSC